MVNWINNLFEKYFKQNIYRFMNGLDFQWRQN
jgi:hypothetical protein